VVGDRNATVSDRLPPEQILSLQAGNETFPARYIADLSGEPFGAVIVLHASGQHPSWPFTVAALLDDLPLHGWSTLSIELPAPAQDATTPAPATTTPAAPPPAAASPANKSNTPTPATTPAAANNSAIGIEPQAQARITAAVKYFTDQNKKPARVVLLGFGSGAIRAAEWTRQLVANQPPPPPLQKTEPISALILIAPVNRLIGLEQDLPKILPSTELPALDIILNSDPQAVADAEARRRAVLHQRQRIYRRLELPPIAGAESAQHSLMVRRVRAWLQRQVTDEPEEYEYDRER
jgi:pyruvate/2-oxoglutarate dehydrogenase complex dihydrolipoamide acyltransferase (E2) component